MTGKTITIPAGVHATVTIPTNANVILDNRSAGGAPITLEAGGALDLVVNGTLKAYGQNATSGGNSKLAINGAAGDGGVQGYAGIFVPEKALLIVSGSGALNAYGGDAGNGGNGLRTDYNFSAAGGGGGYPAAGIGGGGAGAGGGHGGDYDQDLIYGGAGGGGGAGAGIGGNGAAGGLGGVNVAAAPAVAPIGQTGTIIFNKVTVIAVGGGGGTGGNGANVSGYASVGGVNGQPGAHGTQVQGEGAYKGGGGGGFSGGGAASISLTHLNTGGGGYFGKAADGYNGNKSIVVPGGAMYGGGGYGLGGNGYLYLSRRGTDGGTSGNGGNVIVADANVTAINGSKITTTSSYEQGYLLANATPIRSQTKQGFGVGAGFIEENNGSYWETSSHDLTNATLNIGNSETYYNKRKGFGGGGTESSKYMAESLFGSALWPCLHLLSVCLKVGAG